jgi:hypothetical protein
MWQVAHVLPAHVLGVLANLDRGVVTRDLGNGAGIGGFIIAGKHIADGLETVTSRLCFGPWFCWWDCEPGTYGERRGRFGFLIWRGIKQHGLAVAVPMLYCSAAKTFKRRTTSKKAKRPKVMNGCHGARLLEGR